MWNRSCDFDCPQLYLTVKVSYHVDTMWIHYLVSFVGNSSCITEGFSRILNIFRGKLLCIRAAHILFSKKFYVKLVGKEGRSYIFYTIKETSSCTQLIIATSH